MLTHTKNLAVYIIESFINPNEKVLSVINEKKNEYLLDLKSKVLL